MSLIVILRATLLLYVVASIVATIMHVRQTVRDWRRGVPPARYNHLRAVLERFWPSGAVASVAWAEPHECRAQKRDGVVRAAPRTIAPAAAAPAPPTQPESASAPPQSQLQRVYRESAARRERLLMEVVATQQWDDAGEARLHTAEDIERNGIDVSMWPGLGGDFRL